jgi:hypothetical protein
MAPVERNLDKPDALVITRQAVRDTVNFTGQINPNDTLGFLGMAPPDIEPLKSNIVGNSGVLDYVYTLHKDFLAPVKPASTVSSVAEIIFTRSIPDMTQRRAATVVRESASAALDSDIATPNDTDSLEDIGINDPNLLNRFKHAIVEHPHAGVRVFRHIIAFSAVDGITTATTVGEVSTIIITESEPEFN